jgi:hypothetical protein
MQKEYSTLKAEFKSGSLIVTDPGPDFPTACAQDGLISRLNLLAENGWKIKSASVKGNTFTLSIKRIEASPPTIHQYSLLMFQTSLQQSERPPLSYEKQHFIETLQLWNERGWREVKTAYLLTAGQEGWMISLIVKEWPQSSHPKWRD